MQASASRPRPHAARPTFRATLSALALAACVSATTAHSAVDQGRPACDYCRMIITEPAFGAQIGLRRGGTRIYDAIECMAAAVLTDSVPQRDIRSLSVMRHDRPGEWLTLDRAVLLHCTTLASPMGLSLAAFANHEGAAAACPARERRLLDWRGVLTHVNASWFQGKLVVARHAATHSPRPATRRAL